MREAGTCTTAKNELPSQSVSLLREPYVHVAIFFASESTGISRKCLAYDKLFATAPAESHGNDHRELGEDQILTEHAVFPLRVVPVLDDCDAKRVECLANSTQATRLKAKRHSPMGLPKDALVFSVYLIQSQLKITHVPVEIARGPTSGVELNIIITVISAIMESIVA